jgi:hypothetical protein
MLRQPSCFDPWVSTELSNFSQLADNDRLQTLSALRYPTNEATLRSGDGANAFRRSQRTDAANEAVDAEAEDFDDYEDMATTLVRGDPA